MKELVSHSNIKIFPIGRCRFSLFKSPYPAHRSFSAIDIYHGNFGDRVQSPVEGKVIDIREFNTPTPFKNRDFKEYLTVLESQGRAIRLLHVLPLVNVGDYVRPGDEFGMFIKNGYYSFWNDACIHVEIREKDDYIKASNFHPLSLEVKKISGNSFKKTGDGYEFEGRVVFADERYALVEGKHGTDRFINGYTIDNHFIDGCIPTLGYLSLISESGYEHSLPGSASDSYRNFHIFDAGNISISLMDEEFNALQFDGISFTLSLGKPLIKVIPIHFNSNALEIDQKVFINLRWKDEGSRV